MCRPLAEPFEPVDGSTDSFLGDAAVRFVDEYLSKPPPRDAELVTKLVCQEEMKGYQSEPMDRAGMDRLFGTGRWRPMRCLPSVHNNKDRLIADGRRGGHNGYTYEQESLLLRMLILLPLPCGL